MSRAVDLETTIAVQKDDPQVAYKDIVKALCTNTEGLLEIEFIGKSYPLPPDCNVLVDGNSIAVPKAKLVQAFIVARQIFFHLLGDLSPEKYSELQNATAVMLLLDPENLTAANTRKRIVQRYLTTTKIELVLVLRKELLFVDSYLTSRLHRHTKSPTLWSHRRWILEVYKSKKIEHNIDRDLNEIVLIAAERHPRNYYAWAHMRWLVQHFGRESSVDFSQNGDVLKRISTVKSWCLRHPADTSGFSFLIFCLMNYGRFNDALSKTRVSSSVFQDVIRLAISFKWTYESVWVFLRTLVASGEVGTNERATFFQALKDIGDGRPDHFSTLIKAQEWCVKYEKTPES